MKTSFKILISLALAFTLAGALRAAGIDGKWHVEFDTQVGQFKYDFELKADGEKLTGKVSAERSQLGKTETEIKNGKIAKDEVSFTEAVKIQDQDVTIEYKGKLVGDELKLHRNVVGIAEYDIVAKRVVEAKK